jgi:hypothetical protein
MLQTEGTNYKYGKPPAPGENFDAVFTSMDALLYRAQL